MRFDKIVSILYQYLKSNTIYFISVNVIDKLKDHTILKFVSLNTFCLY